MQCNTLKRHNSSYVDLTPFSVSNNPNIPPIYSRGLPVLILNSWFPRIYNPVIVRMSVYGQAL